jgi:hypothetical protein
MKKIIAGLIAALVATAGLMTVSGNAPAQAACVATKYNPNACVTIVVPKPSGVGTSVKNAPKVKKGKTKAVTLSYSAPKGTKATVVIKVGLKGKKATATKTLKNVKAGSKIKYTTPKLKKAGTYTITVTITPVGGKPKTLTYYIKVK